MIAIGLMGSVVTTIEKRFDLTSVQSSWIVASYDISALAMLLVVSYVGAKGHRPRWTAIGLLVAVIGTIIFILPQILSGEYTAHVILDNDMGLCDVTGQIYRGCDQNESAILNGQSNTVFDITYYCC